MDPFAAFKNEVFRPIACLVLPGLLAICPFVVLLGRNDADVANYFEHQTLISYLFLLGAGTIFGMLLENVGASIERGIDRCLENEYLTGHDKVWEEYLSADGTATNGRRYLGTLVTRLKFINSLMPSYALFVLGVFVLISKDHALILGVVVMSGISGLLWLFRVSIELSEAASNTRQRILVGINKAVPNYGSHAITVGRERHAAYALAEVMTSRGSELELKGRSAWAVFPWLLQRTWKWLVIWVTVIAALGAVMNVGDYWQAVLGH